MENQITNLIKEAGCIYRGKIIDDVIYLERHIDEYLSRYFCQEKEKQKDLFEMILGSRLSWLPKLQVFTLILETHKKEFLLKHSNFIKDLEKLSAERNIVAHSLLDTSEEGRKEYKENQSIGFVRFRDGTKPEWRTLSKLNEFGIIANNCVTAIHELLQ
ncbi:MAG TPA: hypothetical protein VF411_09230 [Bacteroidia bacterium]